MARFAIAHHQDSPEGTHYDLFLEADLVLKTWRIQKAAFTEPQPAQAIQDHRLQYLDYEGDVSGKRGRVSIWDKGLYTVDRWDDARIQVAVAGSKLKTRLRLEKTKETWTVADATVQARQLAMALLRGTALEPAPDKELDSLHGSLISEERRILAAVDRFNRGAPVDWPVRVPDPDLRDRIAKARARWKHPWLDAATSYVDGLEKLVGAVRT